MDNFNKIYKENYNIIFRYIISKIHNIELAQEMTNDVFIKLSTRLNEYDKTKASIKTWIITFAKNAVIDFYRKKKQNIVSIDTIITNEDSDNNQLFIGCKLIDKGQLTPFDKLVNKEKMNDIHKAIYSLNGKIFDVAYHFFINELSYDEIAKKLNMAIGSVKAYIHRARKELKDILVY